MFDLYDNLLMNYNKKAKAKITEKRFCVDSMKQTTRKIEKRFAQPNAPKRYKKALVSFDCSTISGKKSLMGTQQYTHIWQENRVRS